MIQASSLSFQPYVKYCGMKLHFSGPEYVKKWGTHKMKTEQHKDRLKNVLGRVGATSFLTVMYKYTLKTD